PLLYINPYSALQTILGIVRARRRSCEASGLRPLLRVERAVPVWRASRGPNPHSGNQESLRRRGSALAALPNPARAIGDQRQADAVSWCGSGKSKRAGALASG